MSSFEVSLQRFVDGDFPMVCARSGAPATQMLEVRPERASSKRTKIVTWLPVGRAVDFASQALDSITRPTGRLPYTSDHTADTIPVLHTPERDTVQLLGVHPAFVRACEERWADTQGARPTATTAPNGPVEQISLGSDPDRAAELVDELRARGFKVGYTPGPGMQRIIVRSSDLSRVSATLAAIDPDRFGH